MYQNQYCRFDNLSNELTCVSLACGDFYEDALVEEGGSVAIVQSPVDSHNISEIDLFGQLHGQINLPQIQVESFTFNADYSRLIVVAEPNLYLAYFASDVLFSYGFEQTHPGQLTRIYASCDKLC